MPNVMAALSNIGALCSTPQSLSGHVDQVLLFNNFFPIVSTCISAEDIARQIGAMVPKWRFFASCISCEPRAAHFRSAL